MDVVRLLIGFVGDSNTAREVDEAHVRARFALKAHREVEENPREGRIVLIRDGVRGKKGMDAKGLGAALAQHPERLEKLRFGHAVLGFAGVVHDAVRQPEESAGVEAAAHGLRDGSRHRFEERNMADVIKVHDRAKLAGELKIGRGRVVRREHDLVPGHVQRVRDHELGGARAIASASVFPQERDERGVGIGLHREVLAEPGVPCKGVAHSFHVGANACFVIEMKGGGIVFGQLHELVFGDERSLHGKLLG